MKIVKTTTVASGIFALFLLSLWIIGPRDKKGSKYKGGVFAINKKGDSLYKKIIRGGIDSLDTLLIVLNEKESLCEKIPYSKKIKFVLDTTRDSKRVTLIDPNTGENIKFLIKNKLKIFPWRGLNKKAFRGIKRY